jgi:hypothetical protein
VRPHPVFETPLRIDTSRVVRKPTPDVWREKIKEKEVAVIPLVKNTAAEYHPGWISYRRRIIDSPEVEIICGGLNEKDLEGAALWRQGHLFHFAFDLAPSEMNEIGQGLLLNSIAYIARFTEDRPIARTPSGWGEKEKPPRSRAWIENLFAASIPDDGNLDYYLSPATKALVRKMDRLSYPKWYKKNAAFLTCDSDGKLVVDANAKELGIPFDKPEFFRRAIEKLGDPGTGAKANELLKRYAPEGPVGGSATQWGAWWQTNAPYLFFSESACYRWCIDPLAKVRGIPSAELRGPARATPNSGR